MLKVGDIVEIMPTATRKKYMSLGGPMWRLYMPDYIGTICTIKRIRNFVSIEENVYSWMKEDLRLIDHQERLNRKYRSKNV